MISKYLFAGVVFLILAYYVYDRRPIVLPIDPCEDDNGCSYGCDSCTSYAEHRKTVGDVLQRSVRLNGQSYSFCEGCDTQGEHHKNCRECRPLEYHHRMVKYESPHVTG